MRARHILAIIALVVIPTAFLSLLAARAVKIQEQNMDRRLEATARQAIDAVGESVLHGADVSHARVTEKMEAAMSGQLPNDFLAAASSLRAADDLVEHVYVVRLPDTFMYPDTTLGTDPSTGRKTGLVRHYPRPAWTPAEYSLLDEARQLRSAGRWGPAADSYSAVFENTNAPSAIRAEALLGCAQCLIENGRIEEAETLLATLTFLFPNLRDSDGRLYELTARMRLAELCRLAGAAAAADSRTWEVKAVGYDMRLLKRVIALYDDIAPVQKEELSDYMEKNSFDSPQRRQFVGLMVQLAERRWNSGFTVKERAALMDSVASHVKRHGLPSAPIWLNVYGDLYSFGPVSTDGRTFGGYRVCRTGFADSLDRAAARIGAPQDFVMESLSLPAVPRRAATNQMLLASSSLPRPFDDISMAVYPAEPEALKQARQTRLRLQTWGVAVLGMGVVAGACTILYRAAAQARKARERSDFIAGVSHDLRTPLASMKMLAESLYLDRVPDPETEREFLKTIVRQSGRLAHLAERILFIVRLGENSLRYGLRSVNIEDLVKTTVEDAATLEIEEGLPEIHADPAAIGQVVMNLIDNAAKYSPGRPADSITVRVARRGEKEIEISVSDRGIGMRPRELKKVFRKFYRASGGMHDVAPGLGMGLSLCRHIVRAHGGRILAESEQGKGSTFRVILPV